jgi:hypothetical protein
MTKLPRWADGEKVFWFVENELAYRAEYDFAMQPLDDYPDTLPKKFERRVVQDAIAAAKQNKFGPLTELLRPEHPMNGPAWFKPLIRDQLPPEAWRLICNRLSGKRVKKGKKGRPKMTSDERRALNPVHDAADMVPEIEDILRRKYTDQDEQQIKNRAAAFAERLAGIDDPESAGSRVRNYLNASKSDRRRIR